MDKEKKYELIKSIAILSVEHNITISVPTLVSILNDNGFTTDYGTEYEGQRGSYTLISAVFKWAYKYYGAEIADKIARAFPKADGTYAFD